MLQSQCSYQEYVTSFFRTASKCVNPALPSVRFEQLLFQYLFFLLSEMCLSFHLEDNGILVEYAY